MQKVVEFWCQLPLTLILNFFRFDTSDGTHRDEKGDLKDKGTEDEAMIVHGSYSFTGADGVVYTVKYTADENGFHPEGDHFTVPAFVPWLKGQPHDDGHYKHDHNVRINQVDTNFPSNADNREVNVRITPKYIPALKKRNLPANEAASHTDLTKKNIADVVAEINKLA